MDELEKLRQKVEKFPKSTLFVQLAEEYRKLGQLDDAIETLKQGIERQPGYMSARISLGRVYMDKKMLKEAAAEFNKVVEAVPDNLLAHRQLADIYMATRDEDKAVEQLLKVLELNPMDEKAEAMLSKIHSGGLDESETGPEQAEQPADVAEAEAGVMELEEADALDEDDATLLGEAAGSEEFGSEFDGDFDEMPGDDPDEHGYEAGEVEIEPDGLYEEDTFGESEDEDTGGIAIPGEEGEPESLKDAAAELQSLYKGAGTDLDSDDEPVGEVHVDEDYETSDLARAAEEVGREVLNEPFDDEEAAMDAVETAEGLETTAYDNVEEEVPTAPELEQSALEMDVPQDMAEPISELEPSAVELEVSGVDTVEGLESAAYEDEGEATYEAMPELEEEEPVLAEDVQLETEPIVADEPVTADEPMVAEVEEAEVEPIEAESIEAEPVMAEEEEPAAVEAVEEAVEAEAIEADEAPKVSFAELIKPVMPEVMAEEAEELEAVEAEEAMVEEAVSGVPEGQLAIANQLVESGEYVKAMNVYNALLTDAPDDQVLKQKMQELRMLMSLMGLDKELYGAKLKAYQAAVTRRRDEFFQRTQRSR